MRRPWLALFLLCTANCVLAQQLLVIGSKRFTESYILGEIALQAARSAGAQAEHKQGMGNTGILFAAIKSGSIDLYPDYTGTVARELLKSEAADLESLNRGLQSLGLGVAVPLGFEDTYALAMLDSEAKRLGVKSISDLARHSQLRFGLSHEFLNRNDGWPGLVRTYALPQAPSGLDHGLAYEALAARQIDVTRQPFVTDVVINTDYDPSRMQDHLFIAPSLPFLRGELESLVRRFAIPVL